MTKFSAAVALHLLNCQSTNISKAALGELAKSQSLREVRFLMCRSMPSGALTACKSAKLTYFDVGATRFSAAAIRALAADWPGCEVRLPDYKIYRVQ